MDLVDKVGLDAFTRGSWKRKLASAGGLCVLLLAAEYYGLVSTSFRWIRRYVNASIAQWLENQGGFPLFTIEGEEPEESKHSWKLPSLARRLAQNRNSDNFTQSQKDRPSQDIPGFAYSSPSRSSDGDLPNFFASTKFFSCLEMRESQELFEATQVVTVKPYETLFSLGESSEPGIFIVLEGGLGVYLSESEKLRLITVLEPGESIGDFDILDGARRSVACKALQDGAVLVQVSRDLFMRFVAAKPKTLQIYLHKAMARLWRVAHFVLSDFLDLSLEQASSSTTSEIAQTAGTIQKAMTKSEAKEELKIARNLQRKSDENKESPSKKYKEVRWAIDEIEDASDMSSDLDDTFQETEAEQRSSGETSSSGFDQQTPVNKTPASRDQNLHTSSSKGSKRFQPSLSAVDESSLEHDTQKKDSLDSPLKVLSNLEDSQILEGTENIAPSPFALHNQEVDSDERRGSFEKVDLGEASSEGTEGDSTIVSSIKSAMTQLRAASLPAALIRPAVGSEPEFLEGNSPIASLQGDSPRSFHGTSTLIGQACLAAGWDIISPEEYSISKSLQKKLGINKSQFLNHKFNSQYGTLIQVTRGDVLQSKDQLCRGFQFLLKGRLLAERSQKEGQKESVQITPGSLISCASFLSSSRARETIRATEKSLLLVLGPHEMDSLKASASDCFVELLLLAARALGPIIRRFLSLGLNRVWLTAGEAAYRQGESAASLYIIISGRLRLVRESPSLKPPVRVEEEVGRGEAVGAIWALAGGFHDTSALCVRDAELVRMSRAAFELIGSQCPLAVAGMLSGMGRRLAAASAIKSHQSMYDPTGRAAVATPIPASSSQQNGATGGGSQKRGEIVTIALAPAGCERGKGHIPPDTASIAIKKLGGVLKHTLEELFGPTLHLSSSSMELMFPSSFQRLHNTFYRSKVTSWMAAQEEDYRFIVMEADDEMSPWTKICISQADCILLVAPEDASPAVNEIEHFLVWSPMGPTPKEKSRLSLEHNDLLKQYKDDAQEFVDAKIYAARTRRVELVMLHDPGTEPKGASNWLRHRPFLSRHHHIRLSHSKDLARLGRWMAGKAIGLVLSGGGSRGLAHLGVLHALDDAGVPVDVIGGTSQGAFMAGLFAQGIPWEQMHTIVRSYASQMSSVRHLFWDLTLPLVSIFTGRGFDRVIKESFSHGARDIEDLWLRFFCMTTNLSRGEPSVHETGLLWKLVRASMTIVGLVPPVYYEGELLVDGGYLNNMPVDVMRGLGVDTVIVVDVEDKDASVWRNLSAYDGGLSGWQLLWDRWCPIPSLRYGIKVPRYQQIINHLTWMSHAQNLKRVSREHVIDLYLQPPVTKFRLMDFIFLERIVRDANRYAFGAIAEWQCEQGVSQQGMNGTRPLKHTAQLKLRRAHSIPCMTQLQMKNAGQESFDEYDDSAREDLKLSTQENSGIDASTKNFEIESQDSDAILDEDDFKEIHSSPETPLYSEGRHKGIFGIHGPMASPSKNDIAVLSPPEKTIQSLPSRKASKSALSLKLMDAKNENNSLPESVQEKSDPIQSLPKPISRKSGGKFGKIYSETDIPGGSGTISSSAPNSFYWPSNSGIGPLALPNQAILPENHTPRRFPPEVRKPSIRSDVPLKIPEANSPTSGLSLRPSFREKVGGVGLSDETLGQLLTEVERAHSVHSPSDMELKRKRTKSRSQKYKKDNDSSNVKGGEQA